MILGTESISVRRYGARTIVNGRQVDGAVTTTTIKGSVQPTKGRDVEHLPEGQRQSVERKVYTRSELLAADPTTTPPRQSDELLINDETYEVVEVQWHRAILPHYRALLMRRATP